MCNRAGIRKTFLAVALTLALLFSALAGTQLVYFAGANPYRHEWVQEGEVSPPAGTKPPTIFISSPKNNTAYASNNVFLTFNVSMAESNNVSLHISEIYYRASWQSSNTSVDLKALNYNLPPQLSINLTDVREGPRWLEVYAVAKGFSHETRHEIKGITYTTYYVSYKIIGSSVVSFTIDTTSPKVSILSIENKTYSTSDVPLNLMVSESASLITYSLDGQDNVTVFGNTTLHGLPEGAHNVTVYAWDAVGNIGATETITFSVAKKSEPFPTTWLIASGASAAVIGVGLIVHFRKRNNERSKGL